MTFVYIPARINQSINQTILGGIDIAELMLDPPETVS